MEEGEGVDVVERVVEAEEGEVLFDELRESEVHVFYREKVSSHT